ncbi:hypothetical protein NM688_g3066 [Phlebia brevispora]|uniref:Uncharacterized protein n=1 Tax=Phlebia brevispora TaxID=194682 RepID=A0ACC1T7H6_9APHY|nr:hypothetical protein NM688_g3066 [Phlebia brevispora]
MRRRLRGILSTRPTLTGTSTILYSLNSFFSAFSRSFWPVIMEVDMKLKEEVDDKRERDRDHDSVRERERDADRDRDRDRDRDSRRDKDRDRERERDRDRRDSVARSRRSGGGGDHWEPDERRSTDAFAHAVAFPVQETFCLPAPPFPPFSFSHEVA